VGLGKLGKRGWMQFAGEFKAAAGTRWTMPSARAIAHAESGFDATRRMSPGCAGRGPRDAGGTKNSASSLCIKQSIGAVRICCTLLRRYKGTISPGAAAYNAGSGTVLLRWRAAVCGNLSAWKSARPSATVISTYC
jgi:hypothetical protein